MEIAELAVGDQFATRGDWQTEPGVWEVMGPPDEAMPHMTPCRAITNPHEGESFWFNRGVHVEKIST